MYVRSVLRLPFAILVGAGLQACAGSGTVTPGPGGQAQSVNVTVEPASAVVAPGRSNQFSAAVTGAAETAVTWSVLESGGGTVDQSGLYVAPQSAGIYRVQAVSQADPSRSATAVVTVASGTSGLWVTGHWAAWQANRYPPQRIDFGAITHLAVAHWLSQPDGTLRWDWSLSRALALDLGQRAHLAGRQALMMVGGSDDLNFPQATSDGVRAAFIANILAIMDDIGYDGVEINWESGYPEGNYPDLVVALARDLRAARPGMTLTFAVGLGWNPWDPAPRLGARLAPYADQLNLMTYQMAWPADGAVSWMYSALHGFEPTHPTAVDHFIDAYVLAGAPKEKLGMGVGFFGVGYTPPVTAPLQPWGSSTAAAIEIPWDELHSVYMSSPSATYGWEDTAKQPYLSLSPPVNGLSYVVFEDARSIAEKGAWARSAGIGGTVIWTINEGVVDASTGQNPALDAVKAAFLP